MGDEGEGGVQDEFPNSGLSKGCAGERKVPEGRAGADGDTGQQAGCPRGHGPRSLEQWGDGALG